MLKKNVLFAPVNKLKRMANIPTENKDGFAIFVINPLAGITIQARRLMNLFGSKDG